MVARLFCAVARATLFGISAWTLPLAVALVLPPFAGTVRAGTPGVEWGEKLGEDIAGLLARARIHNPEFITESLEAAATRAGVAAAGALPDPRFQIELMDVNSSSSGRCGARGKGHWRCPRPRPPKRPRRKFSMTNS